MSRSRAVGLRTGQRERCRGGGGPLWKAKECDCPRCTAHSERWQREDQAKAATAERQRTERATLARRMPRGCGGCARCTRRAERVKRTLESGS